MNQYKAAFLASMILAMACYSFSAYADSSLMKLPKKIWLKATDGTEITIPYTLAYYFFGDSAIRITTQNPTISVNLSGSQPSEQVSVTLTQKCPMGSRNSLQVAYVCTLLYKASSGSFVGEVPGNCEVEGDAISQRYMNQAFPGIIAGYFVREGNQVFCSQELSVIRNGIQLIDPVNGTSQFKFQWIN